MTRTKTSDIEPVRILLVGAGQFGRVHANRIRHARPGCQVVGVCDPSSPDALADLGVPGWRLLPAALAATDPDLVSVVTPTWTHRALTEEVVAAGYRVLVEKPVAMNPDEGAALAAAVARHDGWVDVVSQRRFQEGTRRLQQCVAGGELGTISSATGTAAGWREPEYFAAPWRGQGERGGGNFMNQGMHLLDLLVWLFGAPVRTASFVRPHRQPGTDIDEVCVGIVDFERGAMATVESSLVANPGEPFRIEVRGDRGAAVLTDSQLVVTWADPARPQEVIRSCVAAQALTNQYSAIATAIHQGGPPTVGVPAASLALDLAWHLSRPDGATGWVDAPA